ncbi:hypothetical protein GE21DRAFT_1019467 [Neurospora crassa]|nr:hypothetical protein GE21DRAFT_1019467 [Neurospora crassa]
MLDADGARFGWKWSFFFLFSCNVIFLSSLTLFLNVFPFSCYTSSCINFTCLLFCVRQLRQRIGRYWRMAMEEGTGQKSGGRWKWVLFLRISCMARNGEKMDGRMEAVNPKGDVPTSSN